MIYLLHQGLEESANKYPDHEVARFNGQGMTYQTLNERASQLANLLHDQGIQRHDRVGVFLDKSLEVLIAIYGIMKAGAAFVPIDPRSPVTRVVSIIQDCGLRCVISQENKREVLAEVSAQVQDLMVIGVTGDPTPRSYSWDAVAQQPAHVIQRPHNVEMDLAYVMYTSGSTGRPKGIMHTHYSGLSYVRLSAHTYDVTHADRLSNHSPLHFDMSTFDYLTGPNCGATTIIIPEAFTLFPANLSKLIQDERMTIWYSVPFALIQLLLRGVLDERDLSSLRWILYGGEPFPLNHLRALMDRLPQARFSNVYGPAEVNQCTYYHLPPASEWPAEWENMPLGVIWDNTNGLVLDENDIPIMDGKQGELVIRTPTMMRGYWNRPDLNAKAFYRQEVSPGFEAVYYRTGDLVRVNEAGLLEFFGRKDHQLKIRGYRVELAEIDSALTSHTAVEYGAAYVLEGAEGDEIGASVVLRQNEAASSQDLSAYLKSMLAPYMVPSTILIVDALPRTGTGKVDRNATQQQAYELLQRKN